jgi:hypothetical protein
LPTAQDQLPFARPIRLDVKILSIVPKLRFRAACLLCYLRRTPRRRQDFPVVSEGCTVLTSSDNGTTTTIAVEYTTRMSYNNVEYFVMFA